MSSPFPEVPSERSEDQPFNNTYSNYNHQTPGRQYQYNSSVSSNSQYGYNHSLNSQQSVEPSYNHPAYLPQNERNSKKYKWLIITACILGALFLGIFLLIVVVAVLAPTDEEKFSSYLSSAVSSCGLEENSKGIAIQDNGMSLSLDGEDENGYGGLSVEDEVCILQKLETPDSTVTRMSTTRALDGAQTATWDNTKATWSYHPDNGLDVIIEYNNVR